MENHGSDADDESTDESGEYHNSSIEPRFIPSEYSISSGSKPLSLVLRRCSTPTTENSFSSVLGRNSSVSSPLIKESERTSHSEVLNLEREVNDSHFQKEYRIACNGFNSDLEEFGNFLVPTVLGGRGPQEMSLSSSQESGHPIVTHEYIQNVINRNGLCVEVRSTHGVESGLNFDYTNGSTLLQSKNVFENCCSDNTDGQISLSPVCGRDMCESVESDNKNWHSQHPLENPENTQSLIYTSPSQHCKQTRELSVHIPVVSDSLKFQSSESALLQLNDGNIIGLDNQSEGGSEISTIVHCSAEVSVGRYLSDVEDYIACTEKSGEIISSEATSGGSRSTLQNDTRKFETQIEIPHEPLILQKIDYSLEDMKINTLQDASAANLMRSGVEVSETSVGFAQSSSQFENSANSCPLISTENRQTLSAGDDIHLQKCVQCSYDSEGKLRTESSVCYSPKYPLPSIALNAIQISSEIAKEQPLNAKAVSDIKAEVTKNSGGSSVLVSELLENKVAVASEDCHREQFFKASKTVVSQSHSSSFFVKSHTEDTLDCAYEVSSDAVYVERSPLLFSSDDEKSYYTGKVMKISLYN
jgi:hypothetical protein